MPERRMDIKAFVEEGYLQELNRRFLHPLGLALEVLLDDDGSMRLGGVWDHRDDPEGIVFENPDPMKAAKIDFYIHNRANRRKEALGYIVQPIEAPREAHGAE